MNGDARVDNASRVTATRILISLLVYAAALSGVLTYLDARNIPEPQWFALTTTFMFSLLVFCWYWADSEARSYRRSPLLNVAVVAVAVVAVPYYLLRSRAKGTRLSAFGRLVGFLALTLISMIAGGLLVARIV